jgi:hypothetical protein
MCDSGNDRRIIVHPPMAAGFVSFTTHDIPNVASDSAVQSSYSRVACTEEISEIFESKKLPFSIGCFRR